MNSSRDSHQAKFWQLTRQYEDRTRTQVYTHGKLQMMEPLQWTSRLKIKRKKSKINFSSLYIVL